MSSIEFFIRPAISTDASAMAVVALRSAHFLVDEVDSPESKRFFTLLSEAAMAERIASNDYFVVVATCQRMAVGFLTMRQFHLYHLFVHPEFHGRGLGRLLWGHIAPSLGSNRVAVNSSLCAEMFNRRLGFSPVGEPRSIVPPFVSMAWEGGSD